MPLTDAQITRKVAELRRTKGKQYAPLKYFRGLKTLGEVETRYTKMLKKDYRQFKTDEGQKTKTSSYTQKFRKLYPGVKSLPEIAKATKIPLKTTKELSTIGVSPRGEPGTVRALLRRRGGTRGYTVSLLRGRRITRLMLIFGSDHFHRFNEKIILAIFTHENILFRIIFNIL